MSSRFTGYIELLRPFTLLAPLIVSSCIMIASNVSTNSSNLSIVTFLTIILPASICFAILNGASNALNQATDYKEDLISKPYRPIPKGLISRKEAFFISSFLYAGALLLSFIVSGIFFVFILFIALFSISYSVPPRIKKILFLNQAWVALPRGFFGIVGSWSVFGDPFQPLPLAMGCIAALFLFGGTATKDILDAAADQKVGIKTLVNVFGLQKAAVLSMVFMTSAFLLVVPLIWLNIIDVSFLPLVFFTVLSLVIGWFMIHAHENESCENTSAWTLMYATYFLFAISFTTIIIAVSF